MTRPYTEEDVQAVQMGDAQTVHTSASDETRTEGIYVFPASLEQSRYWILDQLSSASTASNMAIAFRLEGEVRDQIVDRCILALTLRHEALRTTFQMVDGNLSQIISEEPHYGFDISDLRHLPEADRTAAAEALIQEHSRVQIDLAKGPVFAVRLIHVTDQAHFLAFTLHHIACDGWSNGILIRDFAELYAAFSEGRAANLPELPFQFADFTVWQQEWLESDQAKTALDYWKQHIKRDLPAVDLPLDHPRSAQKSFPGHIESTLLSPNLTAQLKNYCRQHDATMHQVLLSAFEALISRYTGQEEFLLGSTIANRTQPGMEHVVGRFAHPQVILADVQGDPNYKELLARVRDWSAKSYAHQDLPFSRLTEEFQLDQAGATSQFLQIYFVYQKAFMQPQEAGALKIIPRSSVSGGVNFDMLVSVVERAEGPRLQVEYNTVLFEQDRIRRFLDQYIRVLEAVMQDDGLAVSALPLLSQEEEIALAKAGHGAPFTKHCAVSLPEYFDQQVEARGESAAIVTDGQHVSWKTLQQKSLQFAHALQKLGVRSGQIVALHMEASADTAAAAIALLRIGAVALPIPSTIESTEWGQMLLRLQPTYALASQNVTGKFARIISVESLAQSPSTTASLSYPNSSAIAWLGIDIDSTGQYETIPISHDATLASLIAVAGSIEMNAGDTALIFPGEASIDVWTDLLLPLMSGASIVYPGNHPASQLQSLLDREQISFAFAKPSEWLHLLSTGWKGDRRLNAIARGARLSAGTASKLANITNRMWSLLSSPLTAGPFSIAKVEMKRDVQWPAAPLPGENFVIVDNWDNPVPYGVHGELTVNKSASLIHTGFLARYTVHRGFEIVEASRRSTRLHSYRLRLGELEDLLLEHPSVAEAVANIHRTANGSEVLAAYVIGNGGTPPASATLHAHLKAIAPGHLASAEIIPVDTIPRNADGSANFTRLPAPGAAKTLGLATADYAPPRDELDQKLISIWEEVLGITGIGIRTSFFELGGYSLMIVRLFARINRVLDRSLPITTIFNAPTIEQLADIIRGHAVYSSLVPVQPNGTKPPLFMIHSYLLYGGLPAVLGQDQPFYGLRELDHDDQMTLEKRVASYVKEIRSVQPHGPYHIAGWCAAGPLAVETALQFLEAGEEVNTTLLFDSWRPGYSAELAAQQVGKSEMSRRAKLTRKYNFHRRKLEVLSASGKLKYILGVAIHKFRSTRDRLYLKNWAAAQWLFTRFGMPLPHFMHNISLTTFHSLQEYKGRIFPGRITLIRATEAHYIPGVDPTCGWNTIARDGVDVLWAPGGHESMFLEPNLNVVGQIVQNCLQEAHAPAS